jgi:pimeloyl-ACP methyl ester carboxylesterase
VIVFVHGVPETGAVWAKVQAAVGGASTAVQLPGFGCPRPDGFGATKDEYVAWLVGELDQLDGPIDLVGHDWGAPLTFRVATAHGDRVRSWVMDVGNLVHPDYEWHDVAKVWQTPDDGEAFVDGQEALPAEQRAALLQAFGLEADDALEMASAFDSTMGHCILDLYRSAVPNAHADWGPLAPTVAPGLVLHPSDDGFSDARLASEVAAALGARFEVLDGAGHFWPYQAPEAAAGVLRRFWSTLG